MSDPTAPDPAPAEAAAPVAAQAVRAAAADLLRAAGVRGPPTLVSGLLAHQGLQAEQFALSDPFSERGIPVPLAQARRDLWPQVRGMVDVPGRVIYTHRALTRRQERFCALHELGHFSLAWHHALLQTCSETDLSPVARAAWEREANLFAVACLFQGDRFAREADGTPFGLGAIRRLANRWAASLEAAGREYVETRRVACAWVVARLRPDLALASEATAGEPLVEVRYALGSRPWRIRAGPIPRGSLLPWDHPATRALLAGGTPLPRVTTSLPQDAGGQVRVEAEALSNGTDVLLLARLV